MVKYTPMAKSHLGTFVTVFLKLTVTKFLRYFSNFVCRGVKQPLPIHYLSILIVKPLILTVKPLISIVIVFVWVKFLTLDDASSKVIGITQSEWRIEFHYIWIDFHSVFWKVTVMKFLGYFSNMFF